MINRLSILTILAVLASIPATAGTPLQVGQVYNSGYNGSTALGAGQTDLDFTILSLPFEISAPVVASPDASNWVQVAGAQWISPTEDQSSTVVNEGDPAGTYQYTALLNTNFLVPTQVTVTGAFAADDTASFIVAGTTVVTDFTEAYQGLTSFTYTFTVVPGNVNTEIDFVVDNTAGPNGTNSPTGLLVSNLKFVTTAAPEPSTWAMMFFGMGALLLLPRLRHAFSR